MTVRVVATIRHPAEIPTGLSLPILCGLLALTCMTETKAVVMKQGKAAVVVNKKTAKAKALAVPILK